MELPPSDDRLKTGEQTQEREDSALQGFKNMPLFPVVLLVLLAVCVVSALVTVVNAFR